jgi:hypothetical protein
VVYLVCSRKSRPRRNDPPPWEYSYIRQDRCPILPHFSASYLHHHRLSHTGTSIFVISGSIYPETALVVFFSSPANPLVPPTTQSSRPIATLYRSLPLARSTLTCLLGGLFAVAKRETSCPSTLEVSSNVFVCQPPLTNGCQHSLRLRRMRQQPQACRLAFG